MGYDGETVGRQLAVSSSVVRFAVARESSEATRGLGNRESDVTPIASGGSPPIIAALHVAKPSRSTGEHPTDRRLRVNLLKDTEKWWVGGSTGVRRVVALAGGTGDRAPRVWPERSLRAGVYGQDDPGPGPCSSL